MADNNPVRLLAEKILQRFNIANQDNAITADQWDALESLLREAMDQAQHIGEDIGAGLRIQAARKIVQKTHEAELKEARSAAYRDAIEIVFKECGNGCTADHRDYILDKLRRKAEGL